MLLFGNSKYVYFLKEPYCRYQGSTVHTVDIVQRFYFHLWDKKKKETSYAFLPLDATKSDTCSKVNGMNNYCFVFYSNRQSNVFSEWPTVVKTTTTTNKQQQKKPTHFHANSPLSPFAPGIFDVLRGDVYAHWRNGRNLAQTPPRSPYMVNERTVDWQRAAAAELLRHGGGYSVSGDQRRSYVSFPQAHGSSSGTFRDRSGARTMCAAVARAERQQRTTRSASRV